VEQAVGPRALLFFDMPLLLLGLLLISTACAQQPSEETIQSFEQVWSTVARRHWDPKLLERLPSGKSWDAVRAEYRERVERAPNDAEARRLMQEMLNLLGQSHYAILAGGAADDLTPVKGGDANPGIDPMLVGDKVLVRGVRAGSPAAQAGVRPGWEIQAIDSFALPQAIARIRQRSVKEPQSVVRALTFGRLSGFAGEKVKVVFAAPGGPRTLTLDRETPPGTVARFGLMPPTIVEFEARRPRPDTGYVRFNFFLDPPNLMAKFEDAVKSCGKCAGFVIDLRGNPGGLAILASSMAGFFIEEPDTKLGTFSMREVMLKLSVNPRLGGFAGPLAILVDGASVSTSEIMAGGLKDLKRARIFGERTAGAALPSLIERLPNGDLFQYAIANYVSEGGEALEGRGVEPDVRVSTTQAALLAGKDPVLDAALDWIHAQKR
jgi:carboxyl-terminal processing protease